MGRSTTQGLLQTWRRCAKVTCGGFEFRTRVLGVKVIEPDNF